MTRRPAVLLFGGLSVVARHAGVIEEARARDLEVLLISSGGDAEERRFRARRAVPGHPFGLVDGWAFLAKPRPDHVLSVVGGCFGGHHIVAALSCGEVFVEPCGVVADLLGLAGPGLRASRVCRNKQLQRAYLADWSPRSAYVAPEARSRAARLAPGFPCVLKPVGRMSSSGVRRADDPVQLGALVAAAPPGEGLLVEELVDGAEFSVEALVRDGRVVWENVTAKLTNEAGGVFFTELGHVVPAAGLGDRDRSALVSASRAVLAALEFRDGISHAEFRLRSGERPVLMEIAARVPGDGITVLLELATGTSLEPVLLDIALGRPVAYAEPRRRAVHRYLPLEEGVLEEVEAAPGVEAAWIAHSDRWPVPRPVAAGAPARTAAVLVTQPRGSRLGRLRDSDARAVSVMVDLPLGEPVEPAVSEQAAQVRVRLGTGSDGRDPASAASAPGPRVLT